MTYRPGQLVRIRARLRADRAGYVDHVTRTQVVLRTGERFSRKTGRLWGAGVSTTRLEPWDTRQPLEQVPQAWIAERREVWA